MELKNLTMIQMEYLKVATLKDENRLDQLKELLTLLKNKKFNHDNTIQYTYTISNIYRLESTNKYIELYYDDMIETTFLKWKYETLIHKIENDIYCIEYSYFENKVKELYYTKIAGNWLNDEQYQKLRYLLKSFYLRPSTCTKVKEDKETKILYISYPKEDIIHVKFKNYVGYNMNYSKIIDRVELLKNKIDLINIENKINELYNENLAPILYLKVTAKNKNDNYENYIQICDRIDKNIEVVKDYFYKNTYNKLTGVEEYNYSIV